MDWLNDLLDGNVLLIALSAIAAVCWLWFMVVWALLPITMAKKFDAIIVLLKDILNRLPPKP